MLLIPDGITREALHIVTPAVLTQIMQKLDSLLRDGEKKTACGAELPRLYITPGKTAHLTQMQRLGLVEKNSIHKRGCGCDPKKHPRNTYALTQKAWDWYIMCHLLLSVRLR